MVRMLVLQLIADALGEPSPFEGKYLKKFDPEFDAYDGLIEVTADLSEALRFADFEAGLACWKQQSRTVPLRPDGEPNRPLTAFTVRFVQIEA